MIVTRQVDRALAQLYQAAALSYANDPCLRAKGAIGVVILYGLGVSEWELRGCDDEGISVRRMGDRWVVGAIA